MTLFFYPVFCSLSKHLILLRLAGFEDIDLDKYFRLVVNKDGADWTFVCPSNYEKYVQQIKTYPKILQRRIFYHTISVKRNRLYGWY